MILYVISAYWVGGRGRGILGKANGGEIFVILLGGEEGSHRYLLIININKDKINLKTKIKKINQEERRQQESLPLSRRREWQSYQRNALPPSRYESSAQKSGRVKSFAHHWLAPPPFSRDKQPIIQEVCTSYTYAHDSSIMN